MMDSAPLGQPPEAGCPFCSGESAVLRNAHAFALPDRYPVTPGHLLIVPRRHVANFFQTTLRERRALFALLERAKRLLDQRHSPAGYNVGINVGEAAGQTVMHAHVHLIPRYRGDVANPRGGVRGVIPAKQSY